MITVSHFLMEISHLVFLTQERWHLLKSFWYRYCPVTFFALDSTTSNMQLRLELNHLNTLFFFLKTRVRFRTLMTPSYFQGSYEVKKLIMNVSLRSSLENGVTMSIGTKQPNTFSATHVQTMCQLATGKKMVVAANGAEARHLQPSVHSGR